MKKILSVILILSLAFSFIVSTTSNAASSNVTAVVKYPITVKDDLGVTIKINKKPKAIVSMTLGTDEMLLSLTLKKNIKALCGSISEDSGISNIASVAKGFQKAESNAEKVIALKPDLVFAADWADPKLIKQLRDAKINVYAYKTPNSFESQKETIKTIAKLVGETIKGSKLIAEMDKKLKLVTDKVGKLTQDKKLTVLGYSSFGTTYSTGTTFDDIVAKAGLINLAAKEKLDMYASISKEKIVELNPDVIFLPSYTYDPKLKATDYANNFKKDPSLATVKAVINNRVYILPENHMAAVSQYLADGIVDAAKTTYPNLFK